MPALHAPKTTKLYLRCVSSLHCGKNSEKYATAYDEKMLHLYRNFHRITKMYHMIKRLPFQKRFLSKAYQTDFQIKVSYYHPLYTQSSFGGRFEKLKKEIVAGWPIFLGRLPYNGFNIAGQTLKCFGFDVSPLKCSCTHTHGCSLKLQAFLSLLWPLDGIFSIFLTLVKKLKPNITFPTGLHAILKIVNVQNAGIMLTL